MLKTLRWFVLGVLLLPVVLVLGALALSFYLLDTQPLVARGAPADYTTVEAGKALIKRLKIQVEAADARGTTLVVSEAELQRLAQLGSHTFDWLNTEVNVAGDGIHARASVRLPKNPAGEYLNVGARLAPSATGMAVERIHVGPLEFSGRWLLPLAARSVDLWLPDKQASSLLASVRGVRVLGKSALFTVYPPPDIKNSVKAAVRALQAARFPEGEEQRALHYYNLLVGMGGRDSSKALSLNYFLTPLMAAAYERSIHGSAVMENRAVIWALAIYFSNGAFENLLGKMVSAQRPLIYAPTQVTLAQRSDLTLHFLYSAGIALATQQGIGVAAGEFKELLDSGNGGSGFSFADLAADRAGIVFVNAATLDEAQARELQQRFVNGVTEADFFPDVTGLREELSEAEFVEEFGSTRSADYQREVELIDRRIYGLPAYAGVSQAPDAA